MDETKEVKERDLRYIPRMDAQDYIDKTREYLDYVEEHIENVRLSFIELHDKCAGEVYIFYDDARYFALQSEVKQHDVSKLSAHELVQYRDKFYPVRMTSSIEELWQVADEFDKAWEHHKLRNTHHHESIKNDYDVIHMIIDWMAMGRKFGDTARQYYERNKDKMDISDEHVKLMYQIFDCLDSDKT